MSFNRVTILPDHACVETFIDGYEDWDSATDIIVEMAEAAESRGWRRILLDFTRVDLRIARSEAQDIAKFFNSFVTHSMSFGVRLPQTQRDAEIIMIFANTMHELGHAVTLLLDRSDREIWLSGSLPEAASG
ncbi:MULTISPECIES: hypothetical protein [Maricaulis]|jgi:hypothetical protein|uniref:Uncharacterized protein n=1 Tax=Maricaulis maris (strain MCS10) TaxID=394221 RepID=Q0AMX4_MARMM|nr:MULTISPECIES: hypothetical protein [Maricaulis]ABI66363.1 hypothetical protein Mmar10_2071 [Maricaulis maris MCS10]MAC90408.1 hypothetical protein [Maricaulis sp.]